MKTEPPEKRTAKPRVRVRRILGWIGGIIALPFFLWIPLGLAPAVPDMIDIFGIPGLRIPAAITIAGLLLGAFGFHKA